MICYAKDVITRVKLRKMDDIVRQTEQGFCLVKTINGDLMVESFTNPTSIIVVVPCNFKHCLTR